MPVAIPSPLGGNHTPAFVDAARTEEAHAATMTITKGLACVAFRVIADAEFYKRVREHDYIEYSMYAYQRLRLAFSFLFHILPFLELLPLDLVSCPPF